MLEVQERKLSSMLNPMLNSMSCRRDRAGVRRESAAASLLTRAALLTAGTVWIAGMAACLGWSSARAGQPAGSAGGGESASVGVKWREISLDEALQEAAAADQMVMVDVWASHCHTCGQQDIDLWETADGAELAEGVIPLKIESTSEAGRQLSERYPITGLPTLLFIRPDGTELDRVVNYVDRGQFLRDATQLKLGVDPLLAMEARLSQNPDNLAQTFAVFERYLFRRRDAEAESLFNRILELDPDNRSRMADRAIMAMARQAEYAWRDYDKTAEYWRKLITMFPTSSSIGGAVDGLYKTLLKQGKADEWLEWICPLTERHSQNGSFLRSTAMVGLRAGFRSPCLGQAARQAGALGVGKKAYMDSIAVVLDGARRN